MPFRSIFFCLPLLAALPMCGAHAANTEDKYAEAREQFVEAYAHVDTSPAEPPQADSERLKEYPLYPYLQAARIRHALLDTTSTPDSVDQRAATFLTYYERDPVAREMRRAWLISLADRGRWELFLKHYRDEAADDALRCRSFDARIALGRTANLTAEIAKQWLTPQSLQECDRAFSWLREQNGLTPELIEQRARLALLKGNAAFARQIAAQLPAPRSAPLLQWAGLLEKPRRGIDTLIGSPQASVDSTAMLAGWTQLARQDRPGAIARYESFKTARGLDDKAASPYALALAMSLSWDRDPVALRYFAQVDPADLDASALEWQTRAALWSGDWKLVADLIASMSSTNRQTARWRYWAARAAEQLHNPDLARQLYTSTLADDNYYSAMAAARLEQPVAPHYEKVVADKTLLLEIQQLPALVRAHELLRTNLRPQAAIEWLHGYNTLSEEARTQAIHLAAEWGWYDQAVTTASLQRLFNDYHLLYPHPYDSEVKAAASLTQLQPELIYGVLRQESLYRADALSSAGARGLLQLLPETARRVAQVWKRPRPAPADLFDPAVNVPLGAANLRGLIDKFNGQTAVALAGYNAGPSAAARWLPTESIDPDIWVENIPFNETRGYVQRVLWHSIVFAWLRSNEPQRTDMWLARITPIRESAVLGSR
ncbi:MAG TPA: transglycosylase SLT domain-containing protein [Steroidobacteraceae bacterium]|jgi:soluble lytic murein transglycosylase